MCILSEKCKFHRECTVIDCLNALEWTRNADFPKVHEVSERCEYAQKTHDIHV